MKKVKISSDILIKKFKNMDFMEENVSNEDLGEIYNKLKTYFEVTALKVNAVAGVTEQFDGVLAELKQISDDVAYASDTIADGAERQLEQIGVCKDAVDNVVEKIADMSRQSQKLMDTTNQITEVNENGKKTVENLSVQQELNQKAINNITEEIGVLLDKSKKISEITQMLYRISSKTNLLALNASIEAARAGEAGRGFSVVANEVRNLSEASRKESENINASVNDIMSELEKLKHVIDESEHLFEAQEEAVKTVVNSFTDINECIESFVEEQKELDNCLYGLDYEKNTMVSAIDSIADVIEESCATTAEVASLIISVDNKVGMIHAVSSDVTEKVNDIKKDFDKVSVKLDTIKKDKLAVVYDIETNFWDPTTAETKKAAKLFNYEVDFFAPKSRQTSASEMVSFLDRIIDGGYTALVISPIEDDQVISRLKKAADNGISIIFINSAIESIPYISLIQTAGVPLGENAAKVADRLIGREGEVIVGEWTDVKIQSIEDRALGFIDRISKNPNVTVHKVGILSGPSQMEADQMISRMLKDYPNAKLIYASNCDWGERYASYFSRNKKNIKVLAVDLTKTMAEQLKKNHVDTIISQRAFSWGSLAIEMFADVKLGKKVDKYVDTGSFEVNASNLDLYSKRM